MNVEAAARALVDTRWDYMNEVGRGYVREYATAAIDAYRTLTDDQWEVQREVTAQAIYEDRGHGEVPFAVHAESTRKWHCMAEAAMRALGFRRAGEDS